MIRLIAVLVAYGNARSIVEPSAVPVTPCTSLAFGIALTLAVAVLTRAGPRLSRPELGLVRRGSARAAAIGALFGVGAAIPALVVLRYPPLLDAPVNYAPIADMPLDALLVRAFVLMPLDTAVPEELAFRGALFAWTYRAHGVVRATVV